MVAPMLCKQCLLDLLDDRHRLCTTCGIVNSLLDLLDDRHRYLCHWVLICIFWMISSCFCVITERLELSSARQLAGSVCGSLLSAIQQWHDSVSRYAASEGRNNWSNISRDECTHSACHVPAHRGARDTNNRQATKDIKVRDADIHMEKKELLSSPTCSR